MNYPEEKTKLDAAIDEIMQNINARLLDTSQFNQLITQWDGDFALVLRDARADPVNALLRLHRNLSGFFKLHNVSTETWVSWLVLAVARSPEFIFAVEDGGGSYEVFLEAYNKEKDQDESE
jgi:hypothetical protein